MARPCRDVGGRFAQRPIVLKVGTGQAGCVFEVEHDLVSASGVQNVVRVRLYEAHGDGGQPVQFLEAGDVLGRTHLDRRAKEDRGRLQFGELWTVREGDGGVRGKRLK